MKSKNDPLKIRLEDIERFADSAELSALDAARVRVYHAIASGIAASRKKLVRYLGMRPSTVSDVLRDLVEDGLVREDQEPKTGRKGASGIPFEGRFQPICGDWSLRRLTQFGGPRREYRGRNGGECA